MALFLNEMRFNSKVQASARDSRIIRNLMEFFKSQRRHYKILAEESFSAEKALKQQQQQQKQSESLSAGKSSTKEVGVFDDSVHPLQFYDPDSEVAIESLDVTRVWREAETPVVKTTKSDISNSMPSAAPAKARLRASTMAGSLAPSADDSQCSVSGTERINDTGVQVLDNGYYIHS